MPSDRPAEAPDTDPIPEEPPAERVAMAEVLLTRAQAARRIGVSIGAARRMERAELHPIINGKHCFPAEVERYRRLLPQAFVQTVPPGLGRLVDSGTFALFAAQDQLGLVRREVWPHRFHVSSGDDRWQWPPPAPITQQHDDVRFRRQL